MSLVKWWKVLYHPIKRVRARAEWRDDVNITSHSTVEKKYPFDSSFLTSQNEQHNSLSSPHRTIEYNAPGICTAANYVGVAPPFSGLRSTLFVGWKKSYPSQVEDDGMKLQCERRETELSLFTSLNVIEARKDLGIFFSLTLALESIVMSEPTVFKSPCIYV
ncbi:hypothetical protein CBL_10740 [Carabus blaptoides fortunei]